MNQINDDDEFLMIFLFLSTFFLVVLPVDITGFVGIACLIHVLGYCSDASYLKVACFPLFRFKNN